MQTMDFFMILKIKWRCRWICKKNNNDGLIDKKQKQKKTMDFGFSFQKKPKKRWISFFMFWKTQKRKRWRCLPSLNESLLTYVLLKLVELLEILKVLLFTNLLDNWSALVKSLPRRRAVKFPRIRAVSAADGTARTKISQKVVRMPRIIRGIRDAKNVIFIVFCHGRSSAKKLYTALHGNSVGAAAAILPGLQLIMEKGKENICLMLVRGGTSSAEVVRLKLKK